MKILLRFYDVIRKGTFVFNERYFFGVRFLGADVNIFKFSALMCYQITSDKDIFKYFILYEVYLTTKIWVQICIISLK